MTRSVLVRDSQDFSHLINKDDNIATRNKTMKERFSVFQLSQIGEEQQQQQQQKQLRGELPLMPSSQQGALPQFQINESQISQIDNLSSSQQHNIVSSPVIQDAVFPVKVAPATVDVGHDTANSTCINQLDYMSTEYTVNVHNQAVLSNNKSVPVLQMHQNVQSQSVTPSHKKLSNQSNTSQLTRSAPSAKGEYKGLRPSHTAITGQSFDAKKIGDIVWITQTDQINPYLVYGIMSDQVEIRLPNGQYAQVPLTQCVDVQLNVGDVVMVSIGDNDGEQLQKSFIAGIGQHQQYLVHIEDRFQFVSWRMISVNTKMLDLNRTKQQLLISDKPQYVPSTLQVECLKVLEIEEDLTPSKRLRSQSQKPQIFKGLQFLITGMNEEEVQHISQSINQRGGQVIELDDVFNTQDYSSYNDFELSCKNIILLSHKALRTMKYVVALAFNIDKVSGRWIDCCTQCDRLVDRKQYLLPTGEIDGDYMSYSFLQQRLFEGIRIQCFGLSTVSYYDQGWKLILTHQGATITNCQDGDDNQAVKVLFDNQSQKRLPAYDQLVSKDWIIESLIAGCILPKDNYLVTLSMDGNLQESSKNSRPAHTPVSKRTRLKK
ncbi:hypothetical protein MIR68_005876 [Amoeboaphelidium protococcarum]|nr:hypothetical protein MIR68_005876 [Amoeboaphelidium protococcarum]